MPKVIVRKCPITKTVFFGDDEYAKHIVALRNRKNLERVEKRYRSEAQYRIWNTIVNDVDTVPKLVQFVKDNLHDILIAYNGGRPEVNAAIRKAELKSFTLDISYRELISNSHDSPRDGVTNWSGRDSDKPCHYPGFVGNLEYELVNDPDKDSAMNNGKLRTCMSFSDALGYIGIHTGNGGGSAKKKYGVRLFQDDFPALRRTVFKAKLQDGNIDTLVSG